MGVSLGYLLTEQGVTVDIYEASSTLAGLAGPLVLNDGVAVDRFYHAILSSDTHLIDLCKGLGIAHRLQFQETKMGFYHANHIYPMNNAIEFLRFPPLGWVDRFRLGLTIMAAQFIRDWQKLEGISVEAWLLQWSGQNTFNNIWRPMLKAKFDGGFDNVPATWIWSRLVRMKSTREGANQKEEAGHLVGGYITLLSAMIEKIEAAGGNIYMNTPVQEVVIEGARATGLCIKNQHVAYDTVACTMQTPVFSRLIPQADVAYRRQISKQEYLGIICPLLVLDRPLTGYWTINITDDDIPFTGIIETTAYIDPKYVGGHHLVYLPKYTALGSAWQEKSDAEIEAVWMKHLGQMFPDFDRASIREFTVHRTQFVEPLHGLNEADLIPDIKTPIENLFLATTSQIYPALTNGESVSRHARRAAEVILAHKSNGKCLNYQM